MARTYHRQGHVQHAQRHILAILDKQGVMNQRDLIDRLGVRSASLSEVLGKLERGGYILREQEEADRRNFVISLTERGKTATADHGKERRESADALFEALSGEERQHLGELLIKIIVDLEEKLPDLKRCRPRKPGDHGHRPDCPHGRGPHGVEGVARPGRHGRPHRERMEKSGYGRPDYPHRSDADGDGETEN